MSETFIKTQSKIYDSLAIAYKSIDTIFVKVDDDYGHIKKECKRLPLRKSPEGEIIIKKELDTSKNTLYIPMGDTYNLILIDIDNKDNTIDLFNNICDENNFNRETLTEITINKGYHYYFTLSSTQKEAFKKLNLASEDNKLFNNIGCHIDIKYTNGFSFGSTYLTHAEKVYKTEIINPIEPVVLPIFLFDAIIDILNMKKKTKIISKKSIVEHEIVPLVEKPIVYNIGELTHILDNLPKKYYDTRTEWRNIGWALGTLKHTAIRELYHSFSKKSTMKYDQIDCDMIFDSSNSELGRSITIATLYKYAKDAHIKLPSMNIKYESYDDFNDILNFVLGTEHDELSGLVSELSKYIKICIIRQLYIVKTYRGDDFRPISAFDKLLSKYHINLLDDKKQTYVKINIVNVISQNIKKFCVHDIVFKPQGAPEKYYNTFKGFIAKRLEAYDIKKIRPILNLIKDVWADGDKVIFDYFIYDIWARKIQFPHIKTGVCPVLISKDGAGKNTITDFFQEYIFGHVYMNGISDAEKLTDRFNSILENKLVTYVNEGQQQNTDKYSKSTDILKTYITEKYINIEKKGVDSYQADDYNMYIIFTNNQNPVSMTGTDRRFFVTNCSNRYVGKPAFFKTFRDKHFNQDVANHLFTYLLSLDLSMRDPRQIPKNTARVEQIKNSMPVFQKWLYYNIKDVIKSDEFDKGCIKSNAFFNIFMESSKNQNIRHNLSHTRFGLILNQIGIKKERKSDGCYYNVTLGLVNNYFNNDYGFALED